MILTESSKRDIQKLQRAVVDGLEDVKAQNIQVFNTEHMSPLFERVIVASGTSNRQTRALAASVIDAVRDAGHPKPRIEGEENGEWIIVDCGQAVVHIMQPAIRDYYHLEELWGEKPVRLKRHPAPTAAPAPKTRGKSVAPSNAAESGASRSASAKAGKAMAAGKRTPKIEVEAAPAKPARKSAAKPSPRRAAPDAASAKLPGKTASKPQSKTPAAKTSAAKSPRATAVSSAKPANTRSGGAAAKRVVPARTAAKPDVAAAPKRAAKTASAREGARKPAPSPRPRKA